MLNKKRRDIRNVDKMNSKVTQNHVLKSLNATYKTALDAERLKVKYTLPSCPIAVWMKLPEKK